MVVQGRKPLGVFVCIYVYVRHLRQANGAWSSFDLIRALLRADSIKPIGVCAEMEIKVAWYLLLYGRCAILACIVCEHAGGVTS